MQTNYLSPKARHDRHRYERAQLALARLLGEQVAEDVMEGRLAIEDLPATAEEADPAGGSADAAGSAATER